jgi:pseudaminic acid biosynthesis-associated methylase
MNDQQTFWRNEYAKGYIEKNSRFDEKGGAEGWRQMLRKAGPIESLLECGSNIGRNISFLEEVLPQARKSIIEISPSAFEIVTKEHQLEHAFLGPILEADLAPGSVDLAYTIGVLIHIHPDHLLANMRKIHELSRRYVLFGEYFNRTPTMIEYQGKADRLWKRDFGRFYLENFPARVVDYGFLWGHEYDAAGFDDITWWLFEKQG